MSLKKNVKFLPQYYPLLDFTSSQISSVSQSLTFRLQTLSTKQTSLCTSSSIRSFDVTAERGLVHAATGSLEPMKRAALTVSREHYEYMCLGRFPVPPKQNICLSPDCLLFECMPSPCSDGNSAVSVSVR